MQLIVNNNEIADLHGRLAAIGRRLGDTAPVMAAIGALLEGSTRQRFADEEDAEGNAWARLAPSTRKSKRRNKGRVLTEFGDLAKSITHHTSLTAARVGTDRHYGQYHQSGTGKMPARAFLGLSSADKTGINGLLNDFLQGVIDG